jgi:hypothetical protein
MSHPALLPDGHWVPEHGTGRTSAGAPSFTPDPAERRSIESLFDHSQFLEQVFAIAGLTGTIGASTSQAEAP